jgi:diphthamide synthase (EF-2-diphthine--ammonia ligase)
VKILLSWSSGKDSAWALHVLRRDRWGEVAGLLTSVNESAGRVSMHGVREEVLHAQAAAAQLPVYTVQLPWPCTNAIYEDRLRRAVDRAVAMGFTHVAFGDLFLEDVRSYREQRLEGTGMEPLFPLWGIPTTSLAREMIAGGLRARIATLDPRVMPRDLIGAEFDESLLARLPPAVDPCAERGEFHTCATAGPMFAAPIDVTGGEIVEREGFVYGDLLLRTDREPRERPADS